MSAARYTGVVMVATGLLAATPALAASDVSTDSGESNKSVGSTAASAASTQTTSIISSGATGGFSGGSGGFSGGGSGGFSGGGSGGSGGFNTGGSGGFGGGGASGGGGSGGGASGGGSGGFSGGSGGGSGTGSGGGSGSGSGSGVGGGGGGGGQGQGKGQPQSFNFRADGKAAGDAEARTAIWAQGLWSHIDKSEVALEMHGNAYSALFGIDRRYYDRVLVGVSAGWEYIDITTAYNTGTYRDQGVTVAPYVAYNVTPAWVVDASLGYTKLWYESSRNNNAATGTFDGSRVFGSANVTGTFAYGNWRFQPRTGVLYMYEHQNGYRDNTGATVDDNGFALGRFSGGGKVGYAFGDILPYVKSMGEWDFKPANSVLKGNGQQSIVDEYGALAGVGVEMYSGGLIGSLESDYGSIGRQKTDVWTMIGRVRYDF